MIKKAYAKVNLVLDCLGKRDDSYHELAGIMHSIDLFDEVSITPASFGINVTCSENIPHDNTAYRAAQFYMEASELSFGLNIHIEKHIPSQAGLGGASADAAAVLRILNEMYGALSEDKLYETGKRVGADVPFCLHGGCAKAGGIGEKLDTLPSQHLHLLLVKDDTGISTKELFAHYDEMFGEKTADKRLTDAIRACKENNSALLCHSMYNALEAAAFDLVPSLESIKADIAAHNAKTVLMTGSGSCIYGVFFDEKSAKAAENALIGNYSFVKYVVTYHK